MSRKGLVDSLPRIAPLALATIVVGLRGVVMAVAPITGQLFGAGRLRECGTVAVNRSRPLAL